MKKFIFIYQPENDGEVLIEKLTITEITEKVNEFHLPLNAYAVIDGKVLKSFKDERIKISL